MHTTQPNAIKPAAALALLIAGTCISAAALHAEFNGMHPRTRFYSDLGRGDAGMHSNSPEPRRRNVSPGERRDFLKDEAYRFDVLRVGASEQYSSDYLWRDFVISNSEAVFGTEAYASYMGFEGSLFVAYDGSNRLGGGNPIEVDYRASYTRKYLNSINTIAFEHQDWSQVASRIGTVGQGFGTKPPVFENSSDEIQASSYWFNETLQTYQSNYYVGMDTWIWLQGVGFRGAGTVGIMANKQGLELMPNGARLQGSVIFQSSYHRDGSSFPGFDVIGEMYWDFREGGFPALLVAGIEYYKQMESQALDRLVFNVRFELAF
jgi:hypothetical protein